jgi:hypothetical protein
MSRPSKSTPKRREAIIDALRKGSGIEQAARAVGVSGAALRLWRRNDPVFDEACQAACDFIGDVAESVLLTRGLKGDTVALIVWLKAHRPELYHRRMLVALGGDADNPLTIDHQHSVSRAKLVILPSNNRPVMTEAEIAAERAAVARESLLEMSLEAEADDSSNGAAEQ